MPNILKKPKSFFVSLMRVEAGLERQVFDSLVQSNPDAIHFKVLGNYDILEFSKLPSIHDANKVNTEAFIVDIATFPCFFWHRTYNKFWNDISDAPCPSLISLKLNETIIDKFGILGLSNIIDHFHKLKKIDQKNFLFYPLSGIGYSEILIWNISNNLEDIFMLIRYLRSTKIGDIFPESPASLRNKGVFINTTTLPLVSFNKVIFKKNWKLLDGNIKPITKIKCSPIDELHVGKSMGVETFDILGEFDLIASWNKEILLQKFIPQLLNFRNVWQDKIALLDTSTSISSPKPIPSPKRRKKFKAVERENYLAEKLRYIGKMAGINKYLINELMSIVSLINSYIARRYLSDAFNNVLISISTLNDLLDQYLICLEENDIVRNTKIEYQLLARAYSMRAVLSQMFPDMEISEPAFSLPPSAIFYISRILLAISNIIDSVFIFLAHSTPPNKYLQEIERQKDIPPEQRSISIEKYQKYWRGFVYFDMKDTYQLHYGEIISMSPSHLFEPLTWTTLSHEISHAYFQRNAFFRLEFQEIKKLFSKIKQEDPQSLEKSEYDIVNVIWELFAHWFDYKHFYSGDIDFYLWAIWGTWLEVPRVFQRKNDYWMRSTFVTICHFLGEFRDELDAIDEKYKNQPGNYSEIKNEKMQLLYRQYKFVVACLKKHYSNEYSSFSLNTDEEEALREQLFYFYHLGETFEVHYFNEDFSRSLNKEDPNLNDHVRSILNGNVIIENISNPFVLLRELLRNFYNKKKKPELSSQSIVSLIYSLWNVPTK